MTPRRHIIQLAGAALAALLMLTSVPSAQAGCGCDHPPPDWAMVMPSFGSHGKVLTLYPDGFVFNPGETYEVRFRDYTGNSVTAKGYVEFEGEMKVRVPAGLTPGPVSIGLPGVTKLKDTMLSSLYAVDYAKGYVYDASLFTAMSSAPMVPTADGVYEAANFEGAVTTDGTLLVSFNLSDVLDATQFAFQFTNLALTYGVDDVVFYNEDGIDLTLFTLSVADDVEHEWGSYYGWTVNDDTGLTGRVFENKVDSSADLAATSDILHYWRHEFWTYFKAHQPGGSHEVTNGMHPDGSLHVDHDHLVLAIQGKVRDSADPTNPDLAQPLEPGHVVFDLALAVHDAENPVEPEKMIEMLYTAPRQPLEPERPTVYDIRKLDGSLVGGEVEPTPIAYDALEPAM